jgi:hypothetical protein
VPCFLQGLEAGERLLDDLGHLVTLVEGEINVAFKLVEDYIEPSRGLVGAHGSRYPSPEPATRFANGPGPGFPPPHRVCPARPRARRRCARPLQELEPDDNESRHLTTGACGSAIEPEGDDGQIASSGTQDGVE